MNASTTMVGLVGATLLTGCAAGLFEPLTPGYDVQGCVEDALRRSEDHAMVVQATATFEQACQANDGGACSALGVIAERGMISSPDWSEAERLYGRACSLGNERGCVNYGKLEERRGLGEENATHIRGLYERACAAGEQGGCAALGRALAHGRAPERDRAIELLAGACREGRGEACFDLAELERRGPIPGRVALEHYVKACVAGHWAACSRLDPSTHVAAK